MISGGQGRDESDLECSAWACALCIVLAVAVLLSALMS